MTTGRRWYLLAFDRDRQDWRSLRLDRMADVRARGSTFVAREAPDAAAYVRRSISASPYRYVARVRYHAPEDVVAQHFSPSSVTIEADGPDACIVTAGADDPERMVFYFATVGVRFRGARTAGGGAGGRIGRRAVAARCRSGREAEVVGEEEERRGEVVVGGRDGHGPVHLLAHRAHPGQHAARSQ